MWYRCPSCRILYPPVNGWGDPAPDKCTQCDGGLVRYHGKAKLKKAGEVDLKVEFGDDITEAERKKVLDTLQQTEDVKGLE